MLLETYLEAADESNVTAVHSTLQGCLLMLGCRRKSRHKGEPQLISDGLEPTSEDRSGPDLHAVQHGP